MCVKPPYQQPVRFQNRAFVRVAASQQELTNHPDIERKIWAITSRFSFEATVIEPNVTPDHIKEHYNYPRLLKLLTKSYDSVDGAMDALSSLELVSVNLQNNYDVKALLGLMCSRDMNRMPLLRDKTVRVISYKGSDKLDAQSDKEGVRGYTTTFESLMEYVMERIPHKEVMKPFAVQNTEYQSPPFASS